MMLRMTLALGLAAIATPALAAAGPPDPRGCPRPASPEGGERERTKALPVPRMLREIMGSSLYHYTVSTLGGARICIDVSWVNDADEHTLSPDKRFVTFGWGGYETYGRKLVDRTSRGQVVEVGAMPAFSPSRRLFAAVDQDESENGSIYGLVLWRVRLAGVEEIARLDDIPKMTDWRIDGWAGEDCLNLSAISNDRITGGDQNTKVLPRDRFIARPRAGTWQVIPAAGANRCPTG
jgi:hypothetical protein